LHIITTHFVSVHHALRIGSITHHALRIGSIAQRNGAQCVMLLVRCAQCTDARGAQTSGRPDA